MPGDTNGKEDIFVRDLSADTITRVSVSTDGAEGNDDSWAPAISADGRHIAFLSGASNLGEGDTDVVDVFVHDLQARATTRVSVSSSGVAGNNESDDPAISADGRYVAFLSHATNLVEGDTNDSPDIFVRDRQSGTTTRVSVNSTGAQGNLDSQRPSMSEDGRFVAFESLADNLIMGDGNKNKDVFVHDRQTGTTTRVSVSSSGAEGNDGSWPGMMSRNGRFVAFVSPASNLVPGDTNGQDDIFVRDRETGTTTRVSVNSSGAEGNGHSTLGSISADGRWVAFGSWASNLVPGDTNDKQDVFVRDQQTGTTTRVSVSSSGAEGNNQSSITGCSGLDCWFRPLYAISDDGRRIAFRSAASNLVPDDSNDAYDLFLRLVPDTSLCIPGPDEVAIYEQPSYGGRCVVKGIGTYNTPPDFAPLPDDAASSIRVGANVEAVLAQGPKLTGPSETFAGDDDDFSNNPVLGDNTMSSFQVQPRSHIDPIDVVLTDETGAPVGALGLNGDGWPNVNAANGASANPLTVTVVVTNLSTQVSDHSFSLDLGSADATSRFYVVSGPGADCRPAAPPSSTEFSSTRYQVACSVPSLPPGASRRFVWRIWVQPSKASRLEAFAALARGGADRETLQVPQAAIHPVVLIHGILGSMPPTNKLLTDEATAAQVLDPFLNSYMALLDNMQKMGLEWDKTLFGLSYDWRQSNDDSARFLADQLTANIIPHSQNIPYVNRDKKADLIGHSMGGLVARAYIQSPPCPALPTCWSNNVRKVIFIAVPHKGFPFDYKTWEGMTWDDYLYNAPLKTGGPLLSSLMDYVVWPTLVSKRFAPTDPELSRDCWWIPPVPPIPPVIPFPFSYIYPDSAGRPYACSGNTIAGWAHDPARARGVHSLPEMLPTDNLLPPYLVNGRGRPFPFGKDPNPFLHRLNGAIGLLPARLGIENIYVIFGDGNKPIPGLLGPGGVADESYRVDPPPIGFPFFPRNNYWRHGKPVGLTETLNGDDLIPIGSTTLRRNGLLPGLPAGNEQRLDAGPASTRQAATTGARHKEIMFHHETQKLWVPRFLGVVDGRHDFPVATDPITPNIVQNAFTMLSVLSACPVNLLITDPQGRRVGYDSTTGRVVNEIPGSIYTTPGNEPQIVLIPNPVAGRYRITATAYADGAFGLQMHRAAGDNVRLVDFATGLVKNGQVIEKIINYRSPD